MRRSAFGANVMIRTCGDCSLCCKLLPIRVLNKSIDTWCQHCCPGKGGCTIYTDRPPVCRGFSCGWMSGEISDHWFPARCKMVISARVHGHSVAEQGMLVTVDPAYPNAWRSTPYYAELQRWARSTFVEIRVGRRVIRLNADGSEQEVYRSKAQIEG